MFYFVAIFSVLTTFSAFASGDVSCTENLLLETPGSIRVFGHCKDWERAFLVLADKRSDVDEYLEELSNLLGIIRTENLDRTVRRLYLKSFYDYFQVKNHSNSLPQRTQNMLDYLEKYNSEDLK